MIALAVVGVLVVVIVASLWVRVGSARAERRSMAAYERGLDLLGDVSRRSDKSAGVKAPEGPERARPHVRPAPGRQFPSPAPGVLRSVPPAKARLDLPGLPGRPAARVPLFDGSGSADAPERSLARPAGPREEAAEEPPPWTPTIVEPPTSEPLTEVVPVVEGVAEGTGRPPSGSARTVRRAATGAAAAVALAAVAVGGWELASHNAPSVSGTAPTTTTPPAPSHTSLPRSSGHARTPATQTTIEPTSSSVSLVTYQAPAGRYTLTFRATGGECWLGAQSQAATTSWLKMWLLTPGEQASYSWSGPLVVRIGAPRYVSISVNGTPLVLPPGNVRPYDVSLTTGTGTSA